MILHDTLVLAAVPLRDSLEIVNLEWVNCHPNRNGSHCREVAEGRGGGGEGIMGNGEENEITTFKIDKTVFLFLQV